MSYEEYLAWANEDVRAEWVNGEVIVHMPQNNHIKSRSHFCSNCGFVHSAFSPGTTLTRTS